METPKQKTKEELVIDYEQRIEKAQEIGEMTLTEGWKVLEDWIKNHFESAKENLLDCPDEEMKEGRGYAKAYKSILLQIEKWIEAGDRAIKKIDEINKKI